MYGWLSAKEKADDTNYELVMSTLNKYTRLNTWEVFSLRIEDVTSKSEQESQ